MLWMLQMTRLEMKVNHIGRSLAEQAMRHDRSSGGHTRYSKLEVKEDDKGRITVSKYCLDCVKEKKEANKLLSLKT